MFKKALLALSLLLLPAMGAYAQTASPSVPGYNSLKCDGTVVACFKPGNAMTRLGYQQFTVATATALPSIPTGTFEALIVCETQTVRWRDDGTNPTASVGMPLLPNQAFPYMGNAASIAAMRIIQTTATATCNVTYYG